MTALLIAPAPASALTETPDQTAQVVGQVFSTATDGTRIFVGEFEAVRGPGNAPKVGISDLGAITMSTGALVTSFTPQVTLAGDTVRVGALALSPSRTTSSTSAAASTMSTARPSPNFAAVNAITGDLIPGWKLPGRRGTVHALVVASSGEVYAGGAFQRAGGEGAQPRGRLLRGQRHRPYVRRPGQRHGAVAGAGGGRADALRRRRIFTLMNGVNRQSVARVSATTGALNPMGHPVGDHPSAPKRVGAGATRRDALQPAKGPNFAMAFGSTTATPGPRIWRRNFVGNVESLAFDAGANRLYFGSHMGTNTLEQSVCGRPLSGLGYMDPASGTLSCTWLPQIAPSTGNGIGAWTLLLTNAALGRRPDQLDRRSHPGGDRAVHAVAAAAAVLGSTPAKGGSGSMTHSRAHRASGRMT